MRHRRALPLLFLTALLAPSACSSDETGGPTTPTDPDVPTTTVDDDDPIADPRAYYEDYTEAAGDDGSSSAALPAVAAEGDMAVDASASGRSGGAAEVVPPEEPSDPDWPDPDEDNVFVDEGDSRWTAVDDDRESTFGLDVDTGSFTVARRMLDEGYLPEPDSIRVEEWINAFDVGDPATGDDALGIGVETVNAPRADDGTQLVRVAVSTQELAAEDRPAANLTFVIDTSGSMDIRERLGLVQSSLALLVNELRPDDTIAIVTYGDEATPVLAPTAVSEAETIIDAIDELGPGGSTNMEAGLLLGYDQAREAYQPDGINVVVLASDGVANVGVTDADVLTQQITQAGEEGIHLVTVGYGMGNYNDHLMEQLADQGDGFYSYIDTFEEAERLFVDDLTPTLTVVAEEAKVQVVFDEDVVESYRLIGYENRQLDDSEFRDDTVDAGELGAGHHVTALYEVRMATDAPPERIPSPDGPPLGEVRLRWTSPESGETTEVDTPIPPNFTTPSTDIQLAALVADLAELFKGNEVVTERGVTLDQLHTDAEALADEGVAGADEVVAMIEQAQSLD